MEKRLKYDYDKGYGLLTLKNFELYIGSDEFVDDVEDLQTEFVEHLVKLDEPVDELQVMHMTSSIVDRLLKEKLNEILKKIDPSVANTNIIKNKKQDIYNEIAKYVRKVFESEMNGGRRMRKQKTNGGKTNKRKTNKRKTK